MITQHIRVITSYSIHYTKLYDNLIITGGSHCGKTILAKRLAKMLYRFEELKTVRIALIFAEKINRLDIIAKKDQLMDCCLIIQNAGQLSRESVDSLLSLNQEFAGRIV